MSLLSRVVSNSVSRVLRLSPPVINQHRVFTVGVPKPKKQTIGITFLTIGGQRIDTRAEVGDTFLNVILKNGIQIEGYGACEGTLTCSTCHLIFKQEDYDRLGGEPEGEESDMLELARDVCSTSRLGCQVVLTPEMDGIVVRVPEIVSDDLLTPKNGA